MSGILRSFHRTIVKVNHNAVKTNNLRYLRYGPVEASMSASVRLSGARPSYRIGVAATREETQSRINDNILSQRSRPA